LLIAAAFVVSHRVNAQGPPGDVTLEDIYRVAMEQHNFIESVTVEYNVRYEVPNEVPSVKKLDLKPFRNIFSFDGTRLSMQHFDAGGPDAKRRYQSVYDAGHTLTLEDSSAIIDPEQNRTPTVGEFYVRSVLQVPLRENDKVNPESRGYYPGCLFPSGAQSAPAYELTGQKEDVDGASCYVIKNPKSTIYVDPKLGFAIRKQVETKGDGKGGRRLQAERRYLDFKDAGDGIFLPMKFVSTVYCRTSDPAEFINKPAYVCNLDVVSVGINAVTDADFMVDIPSGTYVSFVGNSDLNFVVRGNASLAMDSLLKQDSKGVPEVTAGNSRMWLLIGVNVFLLVVIAVFLLFRRKPPQNERTRNT